MPDASAPSVRSPAPGPPLPSPLRPVAPRGALAICLHGIAPRSFAQIRLLRSWLSERGVDRVTLAVIPAPDLHPLAGRAPQLVAWLRHRLALGDAIAQCGLAPRGWSEFAGLDPAETRTRVEAGRDLLAEVELDPGGFIAAAYAYTPALRAVLAEARWGWFADRRGLWSTGGQLLRASARRATGTPAGWLRMGPSGRLLRVDLHPGDLARGADRRALERLLGGASARRSVTYDGAISAQFADSGSR